MRNLHFRSIATLILGLASSASPAHAATFCTIYNFKHPCCGYPHGRLELSGGNLFGTGTGDGLSGDYGQVFELKNSGGTWTETSPKIFDGTDGSQPYGGLISDASGDLYGTNSAGDAYGNGNVFYMFKSGSTWSYNRAWVFGQISGDGAQPACDLIMDSSGNLYGTTFSGGAYGHGTAFELSQSGGTWSETILHSFENGDGENPYAGLVMDSAGNLYGTTEYGARGFGTAFELTQSGGKWSEKTLHVFGIGVHDGRNPTGALIVHSAGVLYGTTPFGGAHLCGSYSCGTVFKVYQSGGKWEEKVLYNFTGGGDGAYPMAELTMNGSNTLYGTASTGDNGGGTLFKLYYSGGVWRETTLGNFGTVGYPYGAVIRDGSGNLYGTTLEGGNGSCTYGCGTVWEYKP